VNMQTVTGTDEFQGKRAVVTGAAGGIGRATAAALVRHGARVAIADVNLEAATRTATELGTAALAVQMDVRERASVESGFAQALAELGGCDILVANAGVSTMRAALEIEDSEWDFNFAVNARGVFLTNQVAARHFVQQRAGVIVNTA
jgi:meso-butanediol dehydrogenase / (S,S)-butanediol dehydrogenase / diacetyl reductase